MITSAAAFTKSDFIGIAFANSENNVVAIFNKIDTKSNNGKTGAMVQSWIIDSGDVPPHKLVKMGRDDSTCGTCVLRSGNGCYVVTFHAPLAAWKAYRNGRYAVVGKDITESAVIELLSGKSVRFGSYGNPSASTATPWNKIAAAAKRNTGYDHEWKTENLQDVVMASVHTIAEKNEAKKRGYRTFRTITELDHMDSDEILCPASPEAGRKTDCENCGLCGGVSNAKNIAVVVHGNGKKKAAAVSAQPITFNL